MHQYFNCEVHTKFRSIRLSVVSVTRSPPLQYMCVHVSQLVSCMHVLGAGFLEVETAFSSYQVMRP